MDCSAYPMCGTAPQAGVDLEPDTIAMVLVNITFDHGIDMASLHLLLVSYIFSFLCKPFISSCISS